MIDEERNGVMYAISIARQIRLAGKGWKYRDGYITAIIEGESKKFRAIYPQYLIIKNSLIIWAKEEKMKAKKRGGENNQE